MAGDVAGGALPLPFTLSHPLCGGSMLDLVVRSEQAGVCNGRSNFLVKKAGVATWQVAGKIGRLRRARRLAAQVVFCII